MTKEQKTELFETMYRLEELAATTVYDGRNYFEQSEGFYKALIILGLNKAYIHYSHNLWMQEHGKQD